MAAASLKAPGSPWKAMRRDVECWGEFAVLGDDDAGDCDDDGFGVGGSGCFQDAESEDALLENTVSARVGMFWLRRERDRRKLPILSKPRQKRAEESGF